MFFRDTVAVNRDDSFVIIFLFCIENYLSVRLEFVKCLLTEKRIVKKNAVISLCYFAAVADRLFIKLCKGSDRRASALRTEGRKSKNKGIFTEGICFSQ